MRIKQPDELAFSDDIAFRNVRKEIPICAGKICGLLSTGKNTSELTNRLEKALDRVKNDEE